MNQNIRPSEGEPVELRYNANGWRAALLWTAAALYASQLGNSSHLLPKFDELPVRLRDEWERRAYDWLEAIIGELRERSRSAGSEEI